jgi:hypothetical protein
MFREIAYVSQERSGRDEIRQLTVPCGKEGCQLLVTVSRLCRHVTGPDHSAVVQGHLS